MVRIEVNSEWIPVNFYRNTVCYIFSKLHRSIKTVAISTAEELINYI